MDYKIKFHFPSNQEFNYLFNSVGWGVREDSKINKHRDSSVFAVCVYDKDCIIGMLRIVGDGSYYTIYDVVVDKKYQGKGIGTLLMNKAVEWYKSIEDDDTYLYLGASEKKEDFYKKFGFVSRPYEGMGAGMKYDPDYYN